MMDEVYARDDEESVDSPVEEGAEAGSDDLPIAADETTENGDRNSQPTNAPVATSVPLPEPQDPQPPVSMPNAAPLPDAQTSIAGSGTSIVPEPQRIFIGCQLPSRKGDARTVPLADAPLADDVGEFKLLSDAGHRRREFELPIDSGDDGNPANGLFPPELANRPRPSTATVPTGATGESVGKPMPRIQVLVTLASARALFEQALELATEKTAPKFQKLARFEIAQVEFDRKSAARAADYRLRGP